MQCKDGARDALGIPTYRQDTQEKFRNLCRSKELFPSLPSPLLQMLVERWGLAPHTQTSLSEAGKGAARNKQGQKSNFHYVTRENPLRPLHPHDSLPALRSLSLAGQVSGSLKPCGAPGAGQLPPRRAAPGHCLREEEPLPSSPNPAGLPQQL